MSEPIDDEPSGPEIDRTVAELGFERAMWRLANAAELALQNIDNEDFGAIDSHPFGVRKLDADQVRRELDESLAAFLRAAQATGRTCPKPDEPRADDEGNL